MQNADPCFFKSGAELRRWFAKNHAKESELWIAYYKKDSGKPSVTYSDSVNQALCFGWIDGVRYSIDRESYKIRFSPRKPRSIWSAVNIKKVAELTRLGVTQPAGIKSFNARTEDRSQVYSFESKGDRKLGPVYEKKLRASKTANAFFKAQIPSYRRVVIHWVMSAKKEETRFRRLQQLIADSEQGLWVPPLRRAQKKV